jgi:hypothetical protein
MGWLCVGLTTVSGWLCHCWWSMVWLFVWVVSLQKVKLVIVVTLCYLVVTSATVSGGIQSLSVAIPD